MSVNETIIYNGKSIVGASSIVAGTSLYPQSTLQVAGTSTLVGNVFIQGGALYPPAPMTGASTNITGQAYGNGTYVASGRDFQSGIDPWNVFDGSTSTFCDSTYSPSAVYTGSAPQAYSNISPYAYANTVDSVTTTQYNGMWIQLQLPSAIVMEYYSVVPRFGSENFRGPFSWRVFGSSDGNSWTTIDSQTGVNNWASPQVFKTYYMSQLPPAYLYFRFLTLNAVNAQIVSIAQWNIYGLPPTPAMSILGGDLAISQGGGLRVGPVALGSNIVSFSNVSGGSNTFVIDSNGRIGIGTTPGNYLQSIYSNLTNNHLLLSTDTPSWGPQIQFRNRDASGTVFNSYLKGDLGSLQLNTNNYNAVYLADAIQGYYTSGVERMRITNTGIGILTGVNPTSNLQVTGNAYISNSVTTTNVFATTGTLSNALTTNNVTVSNTLTVTNAFTSNATTTNFSFDTFTVPFVSCTTLNVASVSNLTTMTMQGTTDATTLFVTGNAYVSNAVTASNLFATSNIGVGVTVPATTIQVNGQVSSKSGGAYGILPPLTWRQGSSATNWNTAGPTNYSLAIGQPHMQCGSNTMVASPQTITFPLAYTNIPIVMITPYAISSNAAYVSSVTISNFQVTCPSNIPFEWLAIGI